MFGNQGNRKTTGRSDGLIAARRREDDKRELVQAQVDYYCRTDLVSRFEEESLIACRRENIRRRYDALEKRDAEETERRRDCLRALYDADMAAWRALAEEKSARVPADRRTEAMRARVAELKSKRENERLALVQELLERRDRQNSYEIRDAILQTHEAQVHELRARQVEDKRRAQQLRDEENAAYDEIWADAQRRECARDAEAQEARRVATEQCAAGIREQISAVEALRREEADLRAHETRCMLQEAALVRLRDAQAHETRAAEARALRAENDAVARASLARRRTEAAEALKKDLEWVATLHNLDEEEAGRREAQQNRARADLEVFREYLVRQRNLEAQRAKEIEEAQRVDDLRALARRAKYWDNEAHCRAHLLKEVISVRASQVEERLSRVRAALAEKEKERVAVEEAIALRNREDAEKREAAARSKHEYAAVLAEQSAQKRERKRQLAESEQLWEEKLQADIERHNAWIKREIDKINGHAAEKPRLSPK